MSLKRATLRFAKRANVLDAEARQRLVRRSLRLIKRRLPTLDRTVRAMRAALEERYLRRSTATAVVLDLGAFPYMGFGASLGWIHMGHLARVALSAPLYVINADRWPFGGGNADCSLELFLQFPLAQIADATDVPAGSLRIEVNNWSNLRRWGYFDDLDWPTCLYGLRPAGFADLDSFRRSLLSETYRLTDFARDNVRSRMAFVPERYLAWHVRRGDKTAGRWQEDYAVPLEMYAQATQKIYQRDPAAPRYLVICTDSEQVIKDARQVLRSFPGGLEVVHDPNEKRWDGYCALQRTGQITNKEDMVGEALTAQKVIEILRGAHSIIGCDSSYLFRVASMLRVDASGVTSLSANRAWKPYYPI